MLTSAASLSGTLGCSELEELWEAAGGSQGEAFTAAEIAMAESGGNQYATGTVGERGYWQINPDHGSLSTYDPMGNAKSRRHHLRRRHQLDSLDDLHQRSVHRPLLTESAQVRRACPGHVGSRYGQPRRAGVARRVH